MPDLLLFVLGAFVTAIVGLAVWSVGLMDVDGDARPSSGRRDSEEEVGPR